jgi:hypothetical protein
MAAGAETRVMLNTTPSALMALISARQQVRGLKRVAMAQGVVICLLLVWIFRNWLW